MAIQARRCPGLIEVEPDALTGPINSVGAAARSNSLQVMEQGLVWILSITRRKQQRPSFAEASDFKARATCQCGT